MNKCNGKPACEPDAQGRERKCNPETGRCKLTGGKASTSGSNKCAGKPACEPDAQGRERKCNPETGRCKLTGNLSKDTNRKYVDASTSRTLFKVPKMTGGKASKASGSNKTKAGSSEKFTITYDALTEGLKSPEEFTIKKNSLKVNTNGHRERGTKETKGHLSDFFNAFRGADPGRKYTVVIFNNQNIVGVPTYEGKDALTIYRKCTFKEESFPLQFVLMYERQRYYLDLTTAGNTYGSITMTAYNGQDESNGTSLKVIDETTGDMVEFDFPAHPLYTTI